MYLEHQNHYGPSKLKLLETLFIKRTIKKLEMLHLYVLKMKRDWRSGQNDVGIYLFITYTYRYLCSNGLKKIGNHFHVTIFKLSYIFLNLFWFLWTFVYKVPLERFIDSHGISSRLITLLPVLIHSNEFIFCSF